jgi:thiamine-phosphate pyrophosphorylase
VRAKQAASAWLLDATTALVESAHAAGAVIIVNDRADIARLAGADGVHLGQDDLAPTGARAVVGADAIVGLSTHTPEQIDLALAQPISYLAIGPVFPTTSKETGYEAVGLDRVRHAARRARARQLPLVAIGGITVESAPEVIAAGADAVAVIGDLLDSGDPEKRVRAYLAALHV